MSKTLVYCNDYNVTKNSSVVRSKKGSLFPGFGWLYLLKNRYKIAIISSDVALKKIDQKELNPADCFLIDESGSRDSKLLIQLGCFPFVQTCLESKLYAYKFYDNFINIYYKNYLFGGDFGANTLFYPSFFEEDILKLTFNKKYNKVAYISSNNNFFSQLSIVSFLKPHKFLKFYFRYLLSGNFRVAVKNCLYNYKLSLIFFLAKKNLIHLYGKNWDNFFQYPRISFFHYLAVKRNYRGIAGKKINLISKYKFTLCIENTSISGYVTEKIIDCLVAGTVPVYRGCPDIHKYFNSDTFIDSNKFDSHSSLVDYLSEIDEKAYNAYLVAGRKWLKSDGLKFSHNYMAKNIFIQFKKFDHE